MRQYPSREGPFPIRLHFEAQEMDDACVQALKASKFLPSVPSPIRIDAFLEKHFQCPVVYEDLPTGILGCTEFTATGRVQRIVVASALAEDNNDRVVRRRLNATFAHEGGHALFHPILFVSAGEQHLIGGAENVDLKKRRILCRDSDFKVTGSGRGHSRWWEYQANCAIGGFLMPRKLVLSALDPVLEESPVTKTKRLQRTSLDKATNLLSEIFDVNPAAARIRLGTLFPEDDAQLIF